MVPTPSSPLTWLLALSAACAYAIPATRIGQTAARTALAIAWALHAASLAWGLLGMAPHFGFATALSITAWLMLTVYGVEQQLYPRLRTRALLGLLGAAAVVLAALFPGLPLQVNSSAWLPLHLALGIASYGLFAAAVVHAALMSHAERRIRVAADDDSGIPLLALERLTFRFVGAGFWLLTATLLAGWLFGEALYGRAWRWDHKTIFSLLSWLTFATLLVGRARFGWRGRHAVHMLYAGALLLLLSYAGSRFVMEVLLERLA